MTKKNSVVKSVHCNKTYTHDLKHRTKRTISLKHETESGYQCFIYFTLRTPLMLLPPFYNILHKNMTNN